MTKLLKSLFGLLNRDLTNRTWTREQTHPYFGEMTYFGDADAEKCYWEAELRDGDLPDPIGITMVGTSDGPTAAEEAFCRSALGDPDGLFEFCRAAFEPVLLSLTKRPVPVEWRIAFRLDGFEVPKDGDATNPWEAVYFVEATGHYFIAQFEDGKVASVLVDG